MLDKYYMEFSPNKILIGILSEEPFGITSFGNIYSAVNVKWYRDLWKKFTDTKSKIDLKHNSSDYDDVNVNKNGT